MATTTTAVKTVLNVIGGAERPAAGGETIEKHAPATGELLSHVARSGAEDVDAAIRAAQAAQPAWARTTPVDRKSTRLNSSHANISYAVFCLKKKRWEEHTYGLKHGT